MYKISSEKLKELKSELAILKEKYKNEISKKFEDLRESVDLTEESSLDSVLVECTTIESRIEEIQNILDNYILVKPKKGGKIDIGSKVVLYAKGIPKRVYTVVSSIESDPLNYLISNESPLGSQLIGKMEGNFVDISLENGNTLKYKIVKVE